MLKQLFCLCALTLLTFANVAAEEKDESKEIQLVIVDESQPEESSLAQNNDQDEAKELACSKCNKSKKKKSDKADLVCKNKKKKKEKVSEEKPTELACEAEGNEAEKQLACQAEGEESEKQFAACGCTNCPGNNSDEETPVSKEQRVA